MAHEVPAGAATLAGRDALWVFYDGECGLCSGAVAWALRHDLHGRLRAVPAQSEEARSRVGDFAAARLLDELHVWSAAHGTRAGVDAVVELLARLPGWSITGRLLGVPPLRELSRVLYRAVARHRAWFGRAACPLPGPRSRRPAGRTPKIPVAPRPPSRPPPRRRW